MSTGCGNANTTKNTNAGGGVPESKTPEEDVNISEINQSFTQHINQIGIHEPETPLISVLGDRLGGDRRQSIYERNFAHETTVVNSARAGAQVNVLIDKPDLHNWKLRKLTIPAILKFFNYMRALQAKYPIEIKFGNHFEECCLYESFKDINRLES